MERWYAVQTKVRQEQVAAENLSRQGYHCFFPQINEWRKRNGKRRLAVSAYFPRYLFIRMDLDEANAAPIRSTIGVSGLVRFGNQILPVEHGFVEALQSRVGESQILEQSPEDFRPGQKVSIEDGLLKGLQAVFEADSGEGRVMVMLDMLGQMSRVEVSKDVLELVN